MSFGCIQSPIGIKQQSFRFFTIICIMLNYNTPPESCCGQITVKHWQNLPISNPKPVLLNINTSTKFVKSLDIYMLLSGNKNMGVSRADNSVGFWWNLHITKPKPALYNINTHTKFCENPLMFTQEIIWTLNMDGRTDVWQTDVLTNG